MTDNLIKLHQFAWYGDCELELPFPAEWTVNIAGNQPIAALDDQRIAHTIRTPIGSEPLSVLAEGKSSATVLLDDLSRPTPTAKLLPIVLEELLAGGIQAEDIVVVLAGGTHVASSEDEILKKTGKDLPTGVKVFVHDSRGSLAYFGKTKRGTPIFINQQVVESELKVGIGCIYPHPAAGFSGGGKILAPGAAGFETIRYLHDKMKGSQVRAGSINHEFRDEIEEIATIVGLDFIVNVTMNQSREISAVFAGDRVEAFRRGVDYAKEAYAVEIYPDADVTIVDMYPFDINFQVAFDRGFWPFEYARNKSSRIILAGFPQGMGEHDLFPVSNPFFSRFKRRLKHISPSEFLAVGDRLRAISKMVLRRKMTVYVVSENLHETDLRKALPKGIVFPGWKEMMVSLLQKHGNKPGITAGLYCCAPLMVPNEVLGK